MSEGTPIAQHEPVDTHMATPPVTVIIATLADEQRAATIWRAIASVARSGVPAHVIVVVNGNRFSPALVRELHAAPGVQCEQLAAGSLPKALRHGRNLVRTEFFAFLDDDDELLDDALRVRFDALNADARLAFVATNGIVQRGTGSDTRVGLTAAQIEADPIGCLLLENWMTSASALYRSTLVSAADLDDMPQFLEWAYMAFSLGASRPFRFLDTPTFRLHDTQGSVSKSDEYHVGNVAALERILALPLPSHVKAGLRRRLSAAHHTISVRELMAGHRGGAWRHHWLSLVHPGGLQYLSYTRFLCLPRMSRPVAPRE